ncbi:MAG: agmatine deiminase family protein [Verrucomicrobiota bacterium]
MREAKTPAELGFRMPPEWFPQEAVWMSWVTDDPRLWGGKKDDSIRRKLAEVAAAITRWAEVRINAAEERHTLIQQTLQEAGADLLQVGLYDHPNDDVWCRDHGPLFVKHPQSGEVAVTDWGFNGWGEAFAPWDQDNAIPGKIAESLSMRRFGGGMVLEGGAIEINGQGQLLTTESVLLNANRNPQASQSEVEQRLRDGLGATEIFWLGGGIEGDDTGGHVDGVTRFVSDSVILVSEEGNRASPNHSVLNEARQKLETFRTAEERPFDIVAMPMPAVCEVPGWRLPVLPVSYVNYLLVNGGVLVPTFRQPRRDDQALGILRDLFPGREMVPIDCLELVEEGGALHCLTQQQPLAEGMGKR